MRSSGAGLGDEAGVAPAGTATRQALIAAGERLFGDEGIDAVPLLAVVRAAGQGNRNAVQYHFGSRDGLVLGIIGSRSQRIEQRRAELLIEAGAEGLLDDVGALVRAMFLPVIEQRDADGRFTFARFLLQYLNHPRSPKGDLALADIRQSRTVTDQLMELLGRALPHLSSEVIEWRFLMLLRLVVTCLVDYEDAEARGTAPMPRDGLVPVVLAMVTAAVSADV